MEWVFTMAISSDFRMGQHRNDDHKEDAPHFTKLKLIFTGSIVFSWRTEVRYCIGLSTCLKMRIKAKIVKYTQIYLFNFHETILDFESFFHYYLILYYLELFVLIISFNVEDVLF